MCFFFGGVWRNFLDIFFFPLIFLLYQGVWRGLKTSCVCHFSSFFFFVSGTI
jgi:hypothetical protein